jgi:phospholipid-binding lipoprotein MlaA
MPDSLSMRSARALGLAAAVAIAGCTPVPTDGRLIADPYEGANRQFHTLNKTLDQAVLRPASQAYATVTPALVRFLIRNGVSNLELPVEAANQVFQGKPLVALTTAGRFGFNTVFGAAGLLDPATEFGLPRRPTDFGETLHVWGVREGAYLELPFFGPSTERDAVGLVVDYAMNPFTYFTGYVLESPLPEAILGLRGADLLAVRANNGELIDQILYESSDSYTELKTSYIQFRRRQLGQETTVDDALPDIFEDPGDAPSGE